MNKELDSFLVELEVFAVQDGTDVWMQGSLLININTLKPYSESDIINTEEFLTSLKKDGEYHIFSCCCGMPDCSGWTEKIQISTQGNIIKWIEPNLNKVWLFDKNIILEQIQSIEEKVRLFKAYFKKKKIHYVGVGYAW